MRINIIDILVLIMDLVVFGYFTEMALNTTDMTTRILACAVMTLEIFFMIQRIKMIKNISKQKN